MKSYFAFIVVVMATTSAQAQTIYKCSDGKGGNTYQQTPCAKTAQTKTVYKYTPEPDAPRDYGQQSGSSPAFNQGQRSYPQQQYAPQPQSNGGLISNPYAPSLQDRLRSIASDPAYKGSPSARRAAMNAAMQAEGYQSAGEYVPPRVPNPAAGIGQPVQVLDRATMQPIPGAIKVAPNRIWDPNTGQYRETSP